MNATFSKQISVIVPTFNEADNIAELTERIHKSLIQAGYTYEVIFIDDNSTDTTREVAKQLEENFPIKFLTKIGKKGKAYSIQEGFTHAQYSNVAFIDADLQYPPEAILPMAEKLRNVDLVVANRKNYKESFLRHTMSRTFKFVFGKMMFTLDYDIQAGLKVFKKNVLEVVSFTPSSAWTFDLEFLHRIVQYGFVIENHDITFSKRKNGTSKISMLKSTLEIGTNALKLKLKKIRPHHTEPSAKGSMRGAGIRFNKKNYVTHTTLRFEKSSITTFTLMQKFILTALFAAILTGIIFNLLGTLKILIATLSTVYFIDVLFNFYVILRSLCIPQEITTDQDSLLKLEDKDLPVYTILCPLYKESHIIPQFTEAISKLSWPKNKLDVILLLEEDDKESIRKVAKMNLPSYMRTVVVPTSQPKTKPKACNYGLSFAKGEYLVIYDAEDKPEKMQLKKAYAAFQKTGKNVLCLQAKLSYYNPNQNLLTRFFTAEYALWFDITLPGFQSVGTSIPLGGTSNHFRTADLHMLQGWDPFNVTEDADLGIRLFKKGYKTALIDSVTLEEANSKWGNWLRQRSRWIKGYMQTYLVHNRKIAKFTREKKIHVLLFQLIIGGKIAFIFINPFLWLATIAYFTLYAYVGPSIEKLYPSVVFYMAAFSLIFGNFLFMYYYMIGVMKRGQYNILKFTFLVPFYWLMISVAGFIALYQLFFKPHYWEKTVHGLHLKQVKPLAPVAIKRQKIYIPKPVFTPWLIMQIVRLLIFIGRMEIKGIEFFGIQLKKLAAMPVKFATTYIF